MSEVALENVPEWLFGGEPTAAAAAPPPHEVALPEDAGHMSTVAVGNLPDWLILG
jgi:hypothetical protein